MGVAVAINPILDELSGLSPQAQQALMGAHSATTLAPPAAPPVDPGLQAPSKIPKTPQMGAAPPAPTATMSSPPPTLGTPTPPHVEAPRGTLPGDQNARGKLEAQPAGITQIHSKIEEALPNHPTLGKVLGYGAEIPARALEAAGSLFAPGRRIESMIPGTQIHHAQELQNLNSTIGKESEENLRSAQTGEANARTTNFEAQPELTQAKQDLAEQKQNETAQHHQGQLDSSLREHGYKRDETGKIIPLSYEEMSPQQQAVTDLKSSQEELANATADLKKAQKENIPTQVAMAQQRIETAQRNSSIAAGRLGLEGEKFAFQKEQAADKQDQPPAAVLGRAYQGRAIMEAGDTLKKEIDKHSDKIGNLGSYWTQYVNGTPISDPEVSGLMARIASYAALQPALHGFRGQQALAEFQKIIGGIPKNAESLKSAIDAIDDTAGIVNRAGSKPPKGSGNAPPKSQGQWNPTTGRYE